MARLQAKLFISILGVAVVAGAGFMPAPAEAAKKLSSAEQKAWKEANVACKGKAKGQKLGFFARRKFVKGCLVEALKGYPNIDVNLLMRDSDRRNMQPTKVDSHT